KSRNFPVSAGGGRQRTDSGGRTLVAFRGRVSGHCGRGDALRCASSEELFRSAPLRRGLVPWPSRPSALRRAETAERGVATVRLTSRDRSVVGRPLVRGRSGVLFRIADVAFEVLEALGQEGQLAGLRHDDLVQLGDELVLVGDLGLQGDESFVEGSAVEGSVVGGSVVGAQGGSRSGGHRSCWREAIPRQRG